MCRPTSVLDQSRPTRRQIALGAVAEPTRVRRDVCMFGHSELRLRLLNEGAVVPRCPCHTHGVERAPAVLAQQCLWSIDGQLEWLRRAGWQIDELHEFLVLVSADVCKVFNFPLIDCVEGFAG